tara:strand:+ start:288 stop:914 length:627 start_codon:yes stop_codon:yes gene_type:complete
MASKLKVDQIEGQSGSTLTIPTGQTFVITDGLPATSGGTGLTTLGNSQQILQVNSSGNALEFTDPSGGKTLNVKAVENSTRVSMSATTNYDYFNFTFNQTKANSKIRMEVQISGHGNNNGVIGLDFLYDNVLYRGRGAFAYTAQNNFHNLTALAYITGASTTGNKTVQFRHSHATSQGSPFNVLNPTSTDDNRLVDTTSTMIVTEYDF